MPPWEYVPRGFEAPSITSRRRNLSRTTRPYDYKLPSPIALMALETVSQEAWISSHFLQNFYPDRTLHQSPNAMDYPPGYNGSSNSEGSKHPSSRNSSGPLGVDQRYLASRDNEIDSLRTTSPSSYGPAAKYPPSKSYPTLNGFGMNASCNPDTSSLGIGDYSNTSTFLEGPDGNMCFEPETMDSYSTATSVTDFNPWLHGWPSPSITNSAHDTYPTSFEQWQSLAAPWPGPSAGCSTRVVPDSQYQHHSMTDLNTGDCHSQSQGISQRAQQDTAVRCSEVGCGKTFSRAADLKRHWKELHDPGHKRLLCGCCSSKPGGFKREEKLAKHKIKFHGHEKGSKLRTCPECHKENTLDVLYFCKEDALDRHRRHIHGIISVGDAQSDQNDSPITTNKVTGIESLSDENKSETIRPESSLSKGAKRGHHVEKDESTKRAKVGREVHERRQQMKTASSKATTRDANQLVDLPKLRDEPGSAAEEILVPDVSISDFFALSKHEVICAIEKYMRPEISFNAFQRSLRLRGFYNITRTLKTIIDDFLGERKRPDKRPSFNGIGSSNLLCMRPKLAAGPPPHSETGTKIFAMRKIEDAALLKVWHEVIIPSLPGLLSETLGDDYAASLVRKGISELSGTATIQIQSHTVPSKTVRSRIRKQILSWASKDICLRGKQVQFIKGCLATLAGSVCSVQEMGDIHEQSDQGSEEEDDPEPYPFYKRFWRTPGPGASIGLLCTNSVAATIGCYVYVDGQLLILTVKHFITKSYDRLLTGESDRRTVLSPALADVDDMRKRFTQIVKDFGVELDEAVEHYLGDQYTEYVSFSALRLLEEVEEIVAKLDVVKKDLSHLMGGNDPFVLGSIAYESAAPSTSLPQQTFGHHMDWALCSVSAERAGNNRHRYQYNRDTGGVDFYNGETESLGAGQPFLDTCDVEANTKVHFVGQATGRQSGEINAARILIRHHGVESEEWGMVMAANGKGGNDTIHRGDSGASIIRDFDNKLVGLLWACTKDGQLVLTPINAVFEDIKLKAPADEVSLPPIDRGSPAARPLRATVHEVDTICRDKATERPKLRRQFRSSDMPSPRRKVVLHSLLPEKIPERASLSPARKAISLPAPLWGSPGSSNFNLPNATFESLRPQSHLAQPALKAIEDREDKHSLEFILTGYFPNKLRNRSTFPQTLGKVPQQTGMWPAENHQRWDSRNRGALSAIYVN